MKNTNQDEFDRELDAALAQFAAVEPRAGLEERVLSNLRSAAAEAAAGEAQDRRWWWWTLAAALTAMIMVALTLAWRPEKPSGKPSVVAQHPGGTMQNAPPAETKLVSAARGNLVPPHSAQTAHRSWHSTPSVVAADSPKLDQFPSPQPLSAQEKILADYVRQFRDQAVQIARVTNAEVQRDRMEVLGPTQEAPGFTEHEPVMSR